MITDEQYNFIKSRIERYAAGEIRNLPFGLSKKVYEDIRDNLKRTEDMQQLADEAHSAGDWRMASLWNYRVQVRKEELWRIVGTKYDWEKWRKE